MFKKLVSIYNKHGAATCTVISGCLTAVSGVWAYRAGKRAGQHPEWTTEQKVMNVVGPAATGVGAVVFAVCAQKTNMAHIAALGIDNVMNEKKRQKLVQKATDVLGEENINRIKQSMHPEPKEEEMPPIGTEQFVFIDDFTGGRTLDSVEGMLRKIYRFQEMLHSTYIVTLGDWLELGGFDRYKKGELPLTEDCEMESLKDLSDDDLGWSMDKILEYIGNDWMDIQLIECKKENGLVYYIIEFQMEPTASVFYMD